MSPISFPGMLYSEEAVSGPYALTMRTLVVGAVGSVAGAAITTVAIPTALGTIGFTGAGIAANSLAASMMSAAAIANGGGIAAGSAVAVAQSIGAAGFSAAATALSAAAGGMAGTVLGIFGHWGAAPPSRAPPASPHSDDGDDPDNVEGPPSDNDDGDDPDNDKGKYTMCIQARDN
ncbi:hypothetical protein LSAT2_014948 [Lamellibrachia satsuma]|nr:hypothetical protein LSAT2_014948 [Lamellibrachia satsuma]